MIKKIINTLILKIQIFYENVIRRMFFYNASVISNVIVFESEGDYCDNARALYEYMIDKGYNNKYCIIWIVNDVLKYREINKGINNVTFISRNNKHLFNLIKFYKLIGKAKYFFFTHPYWFNYRKQDQVVINLWHGTPLKSGGRDLSNIYDYAIVPSKNVISWFKKFIGVKDNQIIISGNPRNDLLFENKGVISKVIDFKEGEKVFLLMPTFRQSQYMKDSDIINPFVIQGIDSEEKLWKFNDFLKKNNIKLLIKIHHLQLTDFIKDSKLSNIIYLQDKDLNEKNVQLYNFVGECDVLLTDYSSIYFDYLLLDRPIGFLIADIDDYKKNRGFIVDNPEDYMPGEKIRNLNDLYMFFEDILNGKDKYKDERKKILNYTNKYKTGNSRERILKEILK